MRGIRTRLNAGRGELPNIVMIGVDTLRADHLGAFGYARPTSPALDRLAGSALVFRRAFSTSAWTAPAWGSVFTGLLPGDHGLLKYPKPGVLRPDAPSLAETLQRAGFVTAGFHGGGFVDTPFGFGRGFGEYRSYGLRFQDSLSACRRWLKLHRRWPFFLFWHAYDCHMPYDPDAEFDRFDPDYRGPFDVARLYSPHGTLPATDADQRHVVAKYDGEILQADDAIGRLLAELESLQLLDRTLVLVLSDHGEEFLEHGCYDHTRTLFDELVHVPLIVKLPRGTNLPRWAPDALFSLADVPALVLDAIGSAPQSSLAFSRPEAGSGRSTVFAETGYRSEYLAESAGWAWQHKKERPTWLQSVRALGWKLVFDEHGQPRDLYDLKADAGEQRNVLDLHPETVRDLQAEYLRHRPPGLSRDGRSEQAAEIDSEEVQERLRDLGYVD